MANADIDWHGLSGLIAFGDGSENEQEFVEALVQLMREHRIDAIDVHWTDDQLYQQTPGLRITKPQ